MNTPGCRLIGFFATLAFLPGAGAADLPEPTHRFDEALVVGNVRAAGRNPTRTDAVEVLLVRDALERPVVDSALELPGGGTRRWRNIEAQDDGWITDRALQGGYAFGSFDAPEATTMLLDARGHSLVYVNGEPRVGDPYRFGSTILPVPIRAGTNDFLFLCGRGGVQAALRPLPLTPDGTQRTLFFLERDDTLPDLVRNRDEPLEIGVVLVNAGGSTATTSIEASRNGRTLEVGSYDIPPMSNRKVGFTLPTELLEPGDEDSIQVELSIDEGDTRTISIPVRNENDKHRVTFRSNIDDSVQYYSVVPSTNVDEQPGLVLSLHGAGVEAQRQASCYTPKDFAIIVAPTNRRSYGFDWEDWGRWDALEVLAHARARYDTDPRRQWITGHSMGGHGTWQLGVLFPGSFAAVAPSAGWISILSYAGAYQFDELNPIESIMRRAASTSDTLAMKDNLADRGVYILHGSSDDNVPVEQARKMRSELGSFHPDFTYHERPGAGHWWGNQCMDWPPLIEFLRERSLPDPQDVDSVDFTTPTPAASPELAWIRVEQQQESMKPSRVRIQRDRRAHRITGTTENVAMLRIDTTDMSRDKEMAIELDGSSIQLKAADHGHDIHLERGPDGSWSTRVAKNTSDKHPGRSGPFKDVFRNRMMFVVGTTGTARESRLLRNKARFDAEQWWYRGNGDVEILDDTTFLEHHDWRDGRNIILYGNSETNAAWDSLIDGEVGVDRKGVTIGAQRIDGDDLAVLMVRPISGDSEGSVAVVAGTGDAGTRLVTTMPYWVSGIGYPDLVVMGTDMLEGNPRGIRAAGFFGNDWTVENGDIAFTRELEFKK